MLTTAEGEVIGLGFSPAGDALAAAVRDGGVFLWNLTAAAPVPVRVGGKPRTPHLFFDPDGRSVTWLGHYGPQTYDRDARVTTERGFDATGNVIALDRTPAGDRLVSQHTFPESALIGWRPADGGWEREWSISTKKAAVFTPTLSRDGGRVALLTWQLGSSQFHGRRTRLELRSATSGSLVAAGDYPPYSQEPNVLAFSPDGAQLVAVHKTTLLVWPVPELGEPRVVRNDSRKLFTAAAYHPSGRYLFATSNDATAHVFETATWSRVRRFSWHAGRLRSVAVSPDGTLAAAGTDTGAVVVWDVDV